jgi:hypothetical protein
MGSKTAGSGGMPNPQGDVPAFDLPPPSPQYQTDYLMPPPVSQPMPQGGMPFGGMPQFPGNLQPTPMPQGVMPQGMSPGMFPGGTRRPPNLIPGAQPMNPPPQMDNGDYLRQLYQQELGRAPDEEGMNYWQQQLGGGMNRDQIRQMFDQSEEGRGYNQRTQVGLPGMQPPPVMNTGPRPGMPIYSGDGSIQTFPGQQPGYPGGAPILPAPSGLGGGMPSEVADALRIALGRRPMETEQDRLRAGLTTDAVAADRARRGLPIY